MKIELSRIKKPCEFIDQATGQLAQYIVKCLDSASVYVQNRPTAYLSLIGANLIFFEVAVAICYLVNELFNKYYKYEELSASEQISRAWSLGTLFISILGGSNWVFCKSLRIPLSPWTVAAVSCATYFIYLCYKSST